MNQHTSEDLAFRRTLLASQRTLLSFVRTALALFGTGVALIKLFHAPVMHVTGWIFIPAGGLVLVLGLIGSWRTYHWLFKEQR